MNAIFYQEWTKEISYSADKRFTNGILSVFTPTGNDIKFIVFQVLDHGNDICRIILQIAIHGYDVWIVSSLDAGIQGKVLNDSVWRTWNDRPRVQAFQASIIQVGENFFGTHRGGIFK